MEQSSEAAFSRGVLYTLKTMNRFPTTGRINAILRERLQSDIRWER